MITRKSKILDVITLSGEFLPLSQNEGEGSHAGETTTNSEIAVRSIPTALMSQFKT
jgi:hypothetical protein